jgi:CBS domain-containing protein
MHSLKEGIEAGSASPISTPSRGLTARAREFMTEDVLAIRESQFVEDAINTLVSAKVSGAPVLDEDGRIVGVISEFDCMKTLAASSFYHEGMPNKRKVSELMSRELHTVTPDTDVFTIAHMFIKHRIRRVLVVDKDRLLGLVSRRDVLRVMRDRFC